jgi:ubiquitin C-terminal hydrolase
MDLVPYNKKYASVAQGMRNMGATCYFNSIMQCILSCPAIFEVLEQNKDKAHIQKNPLAQSIMKLANRSISGDDLKESYIPIWSFILNTAQKRNDRVRMNFGQQDAHEGLLMFLDVLDDIPEIKRLFEHRHRHQIKCDKCDKWVMDKYETNLVFEVQPNLKTEQDVKFKDVDNCYDTAMPLNEFLRKQNGFVDNDYICPNAECKQKGSKFKTTTLTMVPEILPVVLKKYTNKMVTPFPGKLEFLARGGTEKIVYRLVGQSEHSGTTQGGHYWAVCLRKTSASDDSTLTWKMLNDSSVSDAKPGPTASSYILFYCYTHTEMVKV